MQNIYQQIKKEIVNYLESLKDDYSEQCFEFGITELLYKDGIYEVDVNGYYKAEYELEKQTEFILLKLYICYECRQIQISNICLPTFMKFKGIGKKLIYIIFTIAEKEQYGLFIVDMVDSFYQKMKKRGALPCDGCEDAVQIVNETKLV